MNSIRAFLLPVLLISFMGTSAVQAGTDLVVDAKITAINAAQGKGDNFYVIVTGGTGVCANTAIYFNQINSGSPKQFDRAYAAAMAAFVTGKKVWIHAYDSSIGDTDKCMKANFITISD